MKYLVSLIVIGACCLLFFTLYPRSPAPQPEATPASVPNSTVETDSRSSEQTDPSSTIERIQMDSKLLGKEMHASIYLPPDYNDNAEYPVLYLFHGYGGSYGDYAAYLSLQSITDRLIHDNLIQPLIIVEPEYGNSFGINSKPGEGQDPGGVSIGPYEDYLIQEMISYIDEHYNTQASRSGRFIGGISMGGYASLYLGLRHHELFSKIGAHSAALWTYTSSDQFIDQRDWLYANSDLRTIRDPFMLVAIPDILQDMKVYLDAGENDLLVEQDYAFYKLLQEQNADVVWSSSPGGHNGSYWSGKLEDYLLFYGGSNASE